MRNAYDKACTHLVFEGRAHDPARELKQAREWHHAVVSPEWVARCGETGTRVAESLFPHTYNPKVALDTITATPRAGASSRVCAPPPRLFSPFLLLPILKAPCCSPPLTP